jgi:hypothetical protein
MTVCIPTQDGIPYIQWINVIIIIVIFCLSFGSNQHFPYYRAYLVNAYMVHRTRSAYYLAISQYSFGLMPKYRKLFSLGK